MTVQELHIAFREGINQIASFQGDEHLEEEVDRYLTRGQISLITELYNKYTQNHQYSRELSSLEVINKELPVFYNTGNYTHKTINFGKIIPPANYMYPLNIKPFIKGAKICDTNYIETSNIQPYNIAIIPFTDEVLGNSKNIDFVLTSADGLGGTITLVDFRNYNLPTITNKEDKFYFVNLVLEEVNRKNANLTNTSNINNPLATYTNHSIEVYWENYAELHHPSSFIFVYNGTELETLSVNLVLDLTSIAVFTNNGSRTDFIIPEEKVKGTWTRITNTVKDSTGASFQDTSVTREVDKIKAIELIDNPLEKPTRERPHSVHSNGYIWIHTPDKALATKVYLDYIKYPKPISLLLDWNCELDRLFHQDVVNRAVHFALSETANPKLQSKVQLDNRDLI